MYVFGVDIPLMEIILVILMLLIIILLLFILFFIISYLRDKRQDRKISALTEIEIGGPENAGKAKERIKK